MQYARVEWKEIDTSSSYLLHNRRHSTYVSLFAVRCCIITLLASSASNSLPIDMLACDLLFSSPGVHSREEDGHVTKKHVLLEPMDP